MLSYIKKTLVEEMFKREYPNYRFELDGENSDYAINMYSPEDGLLKYFVKLSYIDNHLHYSFNRILYNKKNGECKKFATVKLINKDLYIDSDIKVDLDDEIRETMEFLIYCVISIYDVEVIFNC